MNKIYVILVSTFISFSSLADDELPSWYPSGEHLVLGNIVSFDVKHLSYDDEYFLMSPTVKFSTADSPKASITDLKVGLRVGFTTFTFNNKVLVDHVYVMPISKDDAIEGQ